MDNKTYINKLQEHDLLSADDEKRLFRALNDALTRNKYKLVNNIRKEIAEHYTRLVVNIASKYNFPCIDDVDLINHGICALMKAIDKYEINGSARFGTYAYSCIEYSIMRFAGDNSTIIRPKQTMTLDLSKLRKIENKLIKNNIKPTLKEIAYNMDKSEDEVRKIIDFRDYNLMHTSLNQPANNVDDDPTELIDNIISKEKDPGDVDKIDNQILLTKLLSILTEMQIAVISRKYGLNIKTSITFDDIPFERIRQIELGALQKIRYNFNEKHYAAACKARIKFRKKMKKKYIKNPETSKYNNTGD